MDNVSECHGVKHQINADKSITPIKIHYSLLHVIIIKSTLWKLDLIPMIYLTSDQTCYLGYLTDYTKLQVIYLDEDYSYDYLDHFLIIVNNFSLYLDVDISERDTVEIIPCIKIIATFLLFLPNNI